MSKLNNLLKKIIIILPLFLTQLSCSGPIDPFDTQNKLDRSDLKDAMMKDPKKISKNKKADALKIEAPIPKISRLIMAPPPPVIGGTKTISFSVTEQVPLKDVLIELGRAAQIDIDLDPGISGGIILNAKNRPFKEVIDRIATLGDLRYSYENGVLHFERDTPYMKNYFVDYLVGSQLWTDVEVNIASLLSTSAPIAAASFAASEGSTRTTASSLSPNRAAGIISIFATAKEHNLVTKYLADVEKSSSMQVLIEAKVVEVSLTETYKTGISWTVFGSRNNTTASNSNAVTDSSGAIQGISYIGESLLGVDLNASVTALETFGTTRTISSPRLHAINNQKASLNFGDKLVYFKIDANQNVTTTSGSTPVTTSSVTSTKMEENVGVQLEIVPSINTKTNEILMSIKPTLSIKSGEVEDPASPEGFTNLVPVIQTRTINTIAKVKSGNILVIGGLMKDTTINDDSGVPFLSRIPILGYLFKANSKDTAIVETVIFIKATIVKSTSSVGKVDRAFQEKFDTNKRRFFEN